MTKELQKRIVISIESCKGGTGKSIIALQLAKGLLGSGYATLVIDADLSGTSLTYTLGSNLYPFTEYHPVHEGIFNDNIPQEEQYADFFKDFHNYYGIQRILRRRCFSTYLYLSYICYKSGAS